MVVCLHWTLLFAGYTLCPDACPTTLATLKAVKGQLGEAANRLTVLFLSVDPEQDTPENLARYSTISIWIFELSQVLQSN